MLGKARILQVTPVLQSGGAEHVAAYLAHAFALPGTVSLISVLGGAYAGYLQRRGIRFRVLEPAWKASVRNTPLLSVVRGVMHRIRGRQIRRIDRQTVLSPQHRFLSAACPDYEEKFAAFLSKQHFDVVHVHSLTCGSLLRVAKQAGCRVVFGQHNIMSLRHGSLDIEFMREQLQWVDRVVCPSQAACDDFIQTTGISAERVVAIPNPSFLTAGVMKPFSGTFRVGTASNLQAAKGIDVLLQAWAILKDRGCFPELAIAGGEPEAIAYWEQEALKLGVRQQIRFLGLLNTEARMASFYDQIELLVVPSITESFSLQAIEALSRGIPVLASDIPALREVVGEGGLLFPVGDARGLADGIERCSQEATMLEQLGKQGLERWQARYSPATILTMYNELYDTRGD